MCELRGCRAWLARWLVWRVLVRMPVLSMLKQACRLRTSWMVRHTATSWMLMPKFRICNVKPACACEGKPCPEKSQALTILAWAHGRLTYRCA